MSFKSTMKKFRRIGCSMNLHFYRKSSETPHTRYRCRNCPRVKVKTSHFSGM